MSSRVGWKVRAIRFLVSIAVIWALIFVFTDAKTATIWTAVAVMVGALGLLVT